MVKVAPSILTANFSHLKQELESIQTADFVHLDIMDGHFVPNISFGPYVVSCLRNTSTLPFDAHLMINDPKAYIPEFVKSGVDYITIHAETVDNLEEIVAFIHQFGVKAGVSIKPNTSVKRIESVLKDVDLVLVMSVEPGFGGQKFMSEALEKISTLKNIRETERYHYLIEVDGGINQETARLCEQFGADILVAGSYIYNRDNRVEAIREIRGK